MVLCGRFDAAMQTNALFWHLAYITSVPELEAVIGAAPTKGNTMSRSASAALNAPSSSNLFGRLFATLDRLLMAYAQMSIRNGDIPRYLD